MIDNVKNLIKKLHELQISDPDELDFEIQKQCDAIRDELDIFWYQASEEQKDLWRKYSAELWDSHDRSRKV